MDLLIGYTATKSIKNIAYGVSSPISTIQFNAVEGTNITVRPFFSKDNKDGNNILYSKAELRYGFQDEKLKFSLDSKWNYNINRLSNFRIAGGLDYLQYNEKGIITNIGNSFYSLVLKNNVARLYKKQFLGTRLGIRGCQWSVCRIRVKSGT